MRLSPGQKKQVRRLVAISTELRAEQRSLLDIQHEKTNRLADTRRNLKTVRRIQEQTGRTVASTIAISDADPVATFMEQEKELVEEIATLDERLGKIQIDYGQASRLAEAVLNFSGTTHGDLPGVGGVKGLDAVRVSGMHPQLPGARLVGGV